MNNNIDNFSADEEISLFDIWKKIAQYQKQFWFIFSVIFIVGMVLILSTPAKYNFSQVVKLAFAPDETGQNTIRSTVDSINMQVKKRFYPDAVLAYNLQAKEKIRAKNLLLKVEDAGNNAVLLSVDGRLKDVDEFKFIFQEITKGLSNDTKEYIDNRVKSLNSLKLSTDARLAELKGFYNDTIKAIFYGGRKKLNDVSYPESSKIAMMYLGGQNVIMSQMANNSSALQAQIVATRYLEVVSDLIISDEPVGPSKCVLMILLILAAFFFSFLGVFMVDFVINLRGNKEATKA